MFSQGWCFHSGQNYRVQSTKKGYLFSLLHLSHQETVFILKDSTYTCLFLREFQGFSFKLFNLTMKCFWIKIAELSYRVRAKTDCMQLKEKSLWLMHFFQTLKWDSNLVRYKTYSQSAYLALGDPWAEGLNKRKPQVNYSQELKLSLSPIRKVAYSELQVYFLSSQFCDIYRIYVKVWLDKE